MLDALIVGNQHLNIFFYLLIKIIERIVYPIKPIDNIFFLCISWVQIIYVIIDDFCLDYTL